MLLYLREQSFDFSVNENLIVLYTTEFLLLLAPTKSCLIIVVILYRYNDLSSICNQNTFDEENFDFQIDTASHKAYPLHNLSTKISDILMVSVADFFLVIYLENDTIQYKKQPVTQTGDRL